MNKINGLSFILLVVLSGLLMVFTVSCAKKAVQSDPSMETEQAQSADGDGDTGELDEQALEEKRLEEERLAAEQEAMAARDMFENEDIFFEYDSAALLSDAQATLQEKAAWMNTNSDVTVILEGHCDERGTEAYNLALGERRADAAKTFLIDLGITPERMTTISYGEERPVDPARNEEAWARNRRTHFVIE